LRAMTEEAVDSLEKDLYLLFKEAAVVDREPNLSALKECPKLLEVMERSGLISDMNDHDKAAELLGLLAACTESLVDAQLLSRYKDPRLRPSPSEALKSARFLTLAGGELLGITRWPDTEIRRIVGDRPLSLKMTRQMLSEEWLGYTPGGRGAKRREKKIAEAFGAAFMTQVTGLFALDRISYSHGYFLRGGRGSGM